MRMKIVPAVALSIMSFGVVANVAIPAAHAAPHAYAAGEDGDDVQPPAREKPRVPARAAGDVEHRAALDERRPAQDPVGGSKVRMRHFGTIPLFVAS